VNNGKLIEVKTALISSSNGWETRPCLRWHWEHIYGSGKASKGADRLILVASHRLVDGRGSLLKNPDFFDLDYEEIVQNLKHRNEGITLAFLGGRNFWSRFLPFFQVKAEDLATRYERKEPIAA